MTYERALYWYTHNGATIEQERECESLVKEALEKQIPLRPNDIIIKNYTLFYDCPKCGTKHTHDWFDIYWKPPFCPICGQALDWSEKE